MLTEPRAREEGLVVQELADETLVYDLERDRAHCLNQTAAFIWRQCDGKTSARAMAQALRRKINQSADERLVWLALDQLSRKHLLTDVVVLPTPVASMNRRQLVRALGISAAVALPVVASIVAPMPAQAATCQPPGTVCESSIQCCSGLCSQGFCAGL